MKREFKITQDYIVYKTKEQGVYPIQERDWQRLRENVRRIYPYRKLYNFLSSLFFGMSVSAVFTLIAFQGAEKLASWVIPSTWSILFASVLLGIVLLVLDNQQKEIINYSVNQVLQEMEDIEKFFSKERPDEGDELGVFADLSAEKAAEILKSIDNTGLGKDV